LKNDQLRGYFLILVAATLWATLGVFYKLLINDQGMTPLAAATMRGGLGGLILLAILVLLRVDLRVPRGDWGWFLAYGVFGVALFFVCYVNAIALTGVAVAAVLMYTSPVWVAIISSRWMGESLGPRSIGALGLALIGVALVARIYNPELLRLNGLGILFGLGAGFTYGLYSIFNKVLVRRNRPWVVQVYGLLIGAAVLFLVVPKWQLAVGLSSPTSCALLIGMAIVPTLLASLAFAIGVQWVPISVAAIVAMFEPVVAAIFGYAFFGERLDPGQWLGAVFILSAVVLLRPGAGPSSEPHTELT